MSKYSFINSVGEPCKGGCGKMVNNLAGRCKKCRTTKCRGCGREFQPHVMGVTKCPVCIKSRSHYVQGDCCEVQL